MSISVVTVMLSAKYFGVSLDRDIWIMVTTVLTTIGQAVWGPINETFRTKFVFISEKEGESKAINDTLSLLLVMTGMTLIISIILGIFHSHLAKILIPGGITYEALYMFSTILYLMLPTLLVNQIISIGISILNTYESYYMPEIVGTLTSALNIIIIIALAPYMGIYVLVVSHYIAILLLLGGVLKSINKLHLFKLPDLKVIKLNGFWIFFKFSLPFFFPYFIGQTNTLIEKYIAGHLGVGMISSVEYARQFTVILQGVLSSVITTVMVPMLAKAYAKHDRNQFRVVFSENLSFCIILLMLVVPILVGASTPLCEFFFFRGRITPEELNMIVTLTRYYGISFVAIIFYIIHGYSLLASGKGKIYAFWGVLVQIMVLVINALLVRIIGVYVLPLSLGLSHLLGAFIMSLYIDLDNKRLHYFSIFKYLIAVTLTTFCIYLFNILFHFNHSIVKLLFNIPILTALILFSLPLVDLHSNTLTKKLKSKICRND